MKTNKGFRDENHADELRKAKRLEPIHKSGKERHTIYRDSLRQATRPSMCATPKKETGARSCCTVIWSRCSSGTISSPIFTNRYA